MLRNVLFPGFIIGLLLFATPAWTLDYSGSASIDWSTLTLSGIPINISDDFAPNLQGHAVNLVSSLPPPADPSIFTSFGTGYHTNWSTTEALSITLPEIQLGTGSSIADATHLTASVNMVGPGVIDALINRNAWFHAAGTGNLTVTIGYSLTQVGVPSLHSGFASTATAGLTLNSLGGAETSALATLASSSGPSQTGVLSLTHTFQVGEIGNFTAFASEHASQSVPVPDMLWPTILGMVGIACIVAWRRPRERLS